MSEILIAQTRGATLELTLNRPDKRNALSRALIAELTETLQAAGANAGVRVITLTGAPPSFCAGLDLREVAETTPQQAERDSEALLALFETIDNLSKPVIAAVNGPAVAGGAGLASVCDLVLCAESAVIGFPEIQRGLVPALVMTYLRRSVGERRAKYLMLTGQNLPAHRALEFGLVTEVVPDPDLPAAVQRYAEMLAGYPAEPLARIKALWNRIRPLPHAEAVREARAVNAAMRLTRDSRTGAEQFLRK